MLSSDFAPTEYDREQADLRAHPSCEVCHQPVCLESRCPVYGCCGECKAVETNDGAVHAKCLRDVECYGGCGNKVGETGEVTNGDVFCRWCVEGREPI